MHPWKNPQKSCIVIQNGRQNEVAVIMYVMVLISMGYKEKTCSGGKKVGMVKIYSSESGIKCILKNLPFGR